jgi:hypothetical protein
MITGRKLGVYEVSIAAGCWWRSLWMFVLTVVWP